MRLPRPMCAIFFFNDTPTTDIYSLSLHDALPIYRQSSPRACAARRVGSGDRDGAARRGAGRAGAARAALAPGGELAGAPQAGDARRGLGRGIARSEEHTSELQSRLHLVCRLLLEK